MASEHIQSNFDKDLQQVQQKVIWMAEMVHRELVDSVNAFISRDEQDACDTIEADGLVNESERIIDNLVIRSIVLHQPVASDCRKLIAALRISHELERIGDYATHVAEHSQTLDHLDLTGEEQRVIDMGHAVTTMMEEVIEAYEKPDAAKSELVREQDVDIDELYTKIFADLLHIKRKKPALSDACTHLLFVARSLERVGDLITNIAEEVLYIVNGQFPPDDREKANRSASLVSD